MNKQTVIVVCGVNHSGTSYIAKFLMENGAEPGEYDPTILQRTPYVKYENIYFKNCCLEMIKIPDLVAPENSVKKFVEFMTNHKGDVPLLLKYPKSVYCLSELSKIIGKERMRTVFVMRNTLDIVESNVKKTKVPAKNIFQYYNSTYKALVQYSGTVFITAFERIREGYDRDLLLDYCGL